MNTFRLSWIWLLGITGLVIVFMGLTGCIKSQFPERNYYSLNLPKPKTINHSNPLEQLQLDAPTLAPPFASLSFIYRTSDLNYVTDFYNAFFSSPSQQIQQWTEEYLQHANLFKRILSTPMDDRVTSHYILSTYVRSLYADYRDRAHPQAIITIQFSLYFRTKNQPMRTLMSPVYSQSIPLEEKSSEALIRAWSTGLQKILENLVKQLGPALQLDESTTKATSSPVV